MGERKQNASSATHLNRFCKRWENSGDSSKRTRTKTNLQRKLRVNTEQIYQRRYWCVRREGKQPSIPNTKQLSRQELKKWRPGWNVKPSSQKKTDDWLSGSQEDWLIITRSTQTSHVPTGTERAGLQNRRRSRQRSGGHKEFLCWGERTALTGGSICFHSLWACWELHSIFYQYVVSWPLARTGSSNMIFSKVTLQWWSSRHQTSLSVFWQFVQFFSKIQQSKVTVKVTSAECWKTTK